MYCWSLFQMNPPSSTFGLPAALCTFFGELISSFDRTGKTTSKPLLLFPYKCQTGCRILVHHCAQVLENAFLVATQELDWHHRVEHRNLLLSIILQFFFCNPIRKRYLSRGMVRLDCANHSCPRKMKVENPEVAGPKNDLVDLIQMILE